MQVKLSENSLYTEVPLAVPTKVFIANTYSWFNKGDAAIVLGTVDNIRSLSPNADIVISSATPDVDAEAYARFSISVVSGPLMKPSHGSRIVRRVIFLKSIMFLLVGGILYRISPHTQRVWGTHATRSYLRSMNDADIVMSCGGGFWSGNAGIGILGHIAEVWTAILLRKPVIAIGVSVGHSRQPVIRYLVGATLRRMKHIVLREGASVAHVGSLGVSKERFSVGGDMAFCLELPDSGLGFRDSQETSERAEPKVSVTARLKVGVTARWWSFPSSADSSKMRERYEIELAAALDEIVISHQAEVFFLPQVIVPETDDDRIVQRRVRDRMKYGQYATLMEQDYSPKELIEVISKMDFMIATRFHSAIFSLLAGTPVIAIAYEIKTEGIFKQLGLEHWFLDIAKFDSSSLSERFLEMMEQRTQILEHLVRRIPREKRDAATSAEEILARYLPS